MPMAFVPLSYVIQAFIQLARAHRPSLPSSFSPLANPIALDAQTQHASSRPFPYRRPPNKAAMAHLGSRRYGSPTTTSRPTCFVAPEDKEEKPVMTAWQGCPSQPPRLGI